MITSRIAETDYAYDGNGMGVSAVGDETITIQLATPIAECNYEDGELFHWFDRMHELSFHLYLRPDGQVLSITDPCGNGTCTDMVGTNHTKRFFTLTITWWLRHPAAIQRLRDDDHHPTVVLLTTHEYLQYAYPDGN